MISRVLIVCVGNICRSPLAERILKMRRPDLSVSSSGLAALQGSSADPVVCDVARKRGIELEGHVARQFTPSVAKEQDLVLVMEPGHRREIGVLAPQLLGRTMLFDHWTGAIGIADPYRRSRDQHEAVFALILTAAEEWARRL